jgi:hypothetical protein
MSFVELSIADAALSDAVQRIRLKVQARYREVRSKDLEHYQAEIETLAKCFTLQMRDHSNAVRIEQGREPITEGEPIALETTINALRAAHGVVSHALEKVR